MRRNRQKYIVIILFFLFALPSVFAIDGGPVDPPPPPSPPGLVAPIDGGIFALLLAGLFYGVKKSIKKR